MSNDKIATFTGSSDYLCRACLDIHSPSDRCLTLIALGARELGHEIKGSEVRAVIREWKKMNEKVNHPSHYNSGRIEVIDVIEDWQLDFCTGNAVKYIGRAGKKFDSIDDRLKIEILDLEKAVWYLQRKINRLKGINEDEE